MTLDPIQRMNLKLSAGAVALSLAIATPLFAGSLLLGSVIEAVNFQGLRRSAFFLFAGDIAGRRPWIAVFALRFSLFALVATVTMFLGADPLGLVIGLSMIVPAALIESWRARPAVDENAPALDPDDPAWDRWDPWLARERHGDEMDEDRE